MPDFYSSWAVEGADIKPITNHFAKQYCRDIAFHELSRDLYANYFGPIDTGRYMPYNSLQFRCGWWHWLRQRENDLTFTVDIAQHAAGIFADKLLYAERVDQMRSYSIPLIIENLADKLPGVSFTQQEYELGFSGQGMSGIHIVGNYDIVPAFYWAAYLQRCAMRNRSPWNNIAKLIQVAGDISHSDVWKDVLGGTAVSGILCMAHTSGPLSARANQSSGSEVRLTEDVLSDMMKRSPLYKLFGEYNVPVK